MQMSTRTSRLLCGPSFPSQRHGPHAIALRISLTPLAVACSLVLETLRQVNQEDPDRKCFRMIGGSLVQRTVKDILPSLQANQQGVKLRPSCAPLVRSRTSRLTVVHSPVHGRLP